jgi:FkbH-like protein
MDFRHLKANLKKDFTGFKKIKVAILADSATQFLHQAIRGAGYEKKLDIEIWEADYDAIDLTVSSEDSPLYSFKPDFVILFLSVQKLQKKFYKSASNPLFHKASFDYIKDVTETVNKHIGTKFIISNFPDALDPVMGNFSNKLKNTFTYQLRRLNLELMEWAQNKSNVFIFDLCGLQAIHGNKNAIDYKTYIITDIVFNLDFVVHAALNYVQIILPFTGNVKKCLILDLDNTLWGGIIGDDGMENIQIGELGIGKAFTDVQLWAKALKERGIILAVCSKNDEKIAKEPFEKHPDMVLRLDDIALFVANWDNKVDNLKHIQAVLNIGFDSMVFLDDNPFERNMVRTYLADICVPELPEDPAEYLPYLTEQNLFETNSFTSEDKERTALYKEEAQRNISKLSFKSEADFLKNLDMVSEVKPFNKFTIPRVAQLTQRSNQFNLRTVRYSDEQIEKISGSDKHITFTFSLSDKYGAHGLISVIILEKKDKQTLFIDTWIMSCRVLKRGMEQFVLNEILNRAKENGFTKIEGEYLPTPKNGLVKNHYMSLGFTHLNENKWIFDTKTNKTDLNFFITKT